MQNDNEQNYMEAVQYMTNLARATFGDTLKQYYEGDPINIPIANLPCFIAEKLSTTLGVDNAPTQHDSVVETISLRIVFNKLDDSGASDNYDLTERKLRKLVEGRDPVTGQFIKDSLMYALRTDISLGQTVRNQNIEIIYGINPRTPDLLTSEAQITVTISEIVQVPNRV